MKKMFVLALIFSPMAEAATCTDLKTCAKVMFDLTEQRYIWGAGAESVKFGAAPDVDLTKENADVLFTALLDQSGYARLPVGDGKTYRIVRGAELKEIEQPLIEASATQVPTFGKTWDWVTMRYKLKSADLANYIERAYRLHLPREARMQADENTGTILITGANPVVRQMYQTLKAADQPMSSALKEKIKADEKRWHEMELSRVRAKKD